MEADHGGTAPDVKDDPGTEQQERGPRRWPRLRLWLPYLVKPLRRTVLLFVLLLIVEYLVVPELVGASKDLYLLGQVNAVWLAVGLILEGLSLFCYAVLTKVLLPPGPKPSLSVLFRIDLSAAAVAHVIPAGTLGTAALGFKLFTDEGISGNDAGVMMAAKGIGSTVVLNVLLWVSLVISIVLAGFQPIYGTVAIIGTVVLLGVAALVFGVTRGAGTGFPGPARGRRQDPRAERRARRARHHGRRSHVRHDGPRQARAFPGPALGLPQLAARRGLAVVFRSGVREAG